MKIQNFTVVIRARGGEKGFHHNKMGTLFTVAIFPLIISPKEKVKISQQVGDQRDLKGF